MIMKEIRGNTELEKQFIKTFHQLCNRHHSWQVWQDFIEMSACAIANAVDQRKEVWKLRENSYMDIVKRYSKDELNLICELFSITVLALEENAAQDFLGNFYMQLDFGKNWHGQYFTPWHVAELMAKLEMGDSAKEEIAVNGYISVNDSCCGSGCMLMAFANTCKEDTNINYQQSVLFIGQDVDEVVAKMCYIQISLLGCPGYVVIGNSLLEPIRGGVLEPVYKKPENIWFTPLYFMNIWTFRRIRASTDGKADKITATCKTTQEPESFKLKAKNKPFSWKDFFLGKRGKT